MPPIRLLTLFPRFFLVETVIHAALRSVHGEETIEENLSGYHLSLEISQAYHGMMIAIPAEEWAVFQNLTTAQLASLLKQLTKGVSLETLQKQKRGPRIQSLHEITPATENTSPLQSYSQEEITDKSHLHRAASQAQLLPLILPLVLQSRIVNSACLGLPELLFFPADAVLRQMKAADQRFALLEENNEHCKTNKLRFRRRLSVRRAEIVRKA